jgi:hypothetical protein
LPRQEKGQQNPGNVGNMPIDLKGLRRQFPSSGLLKCSSYRKLCTIHMFFGILRGAGTTRKLAAQFRTCFFPFSLAGIEHKLVLQKNLVWITAKPAGYRFIQQERSEATRSRLA